MAKKASKNKENNTTPNPEIPEMKVAVGEGMRRLPVYLLLDTSGSMAGAPIEAVRRGLELFKQEGEQDTEMKETIHVGIITFGGEADFITRSLIPFDDFEPPALSANGQTPLGQAFWLLIESLDKDVKAPIKGKEKGDYKPLIFVLTDGQPTDEWQEPREEILKREKKKVINIITVGCGPYINQENLKDIAIGPTFNMGSDDASFRKFFQWVTQTAMTVTKSVTQPGGGEKPTTISPPPEGIQYIP
ncbi:MAG: hypothetical protein COS87_03930 [Chloroflexi bacterium CG07_land_8_20_14_0_80_45_17]|nr:MAG: hypothetical protein COS87_03930 [Chloroflexi bacterium CG07_land_8_20_14_0_80_45_17]